MVTETERKPTLRQLREQALPPVFQRLLPRLSKDDRDKLPRVYPKLPAVITNRINALPSYDPAGPHLAHLSIERKGERSNKMFRLHHVSAFYVPGGPRAELIDALYTTLENTSYDYGHGIDVYDLSIEPAMLQKVLLIAQALKIIDEVVPEDNPLVVTSEYDDCLHLSSTVLGHTYEHMIRFPAQAKMIAKRWVTKHAS